MSIRFTTLHRQSINHNDKTITEITIVYNGKFPTSTYYISLSRDDLFFSFGHLCTNSPLMIVSPPTHVADLKARM